MQQPPEPATVFARGRKHSSREATVIPVPGDRSPTRDHQEGNGACFQSVVTCPSTRRPDALRSRRGLGWPRRTALGQPLHDTRLSVEWRLVKREPMPLCHSRVTLTLDGLAETDDDDRRGAVVAHNHGAGESLVRR